MFLPRVAHLLLVVALGGAAPIVAGLALGGASGLQMAFADDDDGGGDDGDDDDDGGFSSREGGGSVSPGRNIGGRLFRDLRDRFRPRGSGRRAAQPAPPPPAFAPNEIVAIGLSDADAAALQADGFSIARRETLNGLGASIVKLGIPTGQTLDQAASAVRARAPSASIDFNHYYRPGQGDADCSDNHCVAPGLISWPGPVGSSCTGEGLSLGMIDTAINADHAAFEEGQLEVMRLSADDLPESNRQHGTAVAALLIGAAGSKTPGLLPDARLVAVDVFHRGARSDDRAEAFDLVRGLNHLRSAGVSVVNLSLAGPENAVVAQAIRAVTASGIVVVAAAGNDGPRADPRFPAAYDEVIAVTAVDRRKRAWRRAVQGDHIDLAAPGVDIWAAASVSGARPKTGTSFAAPFVTAAAALAHGGQTDVAARLTAAAEDLGDPGKDRVFGWGLLNAADLCAGPN